MLRINKKMEYGILALLYLDRRPEKVASVREIAEHYRIPLALLSKVMQTMKNRQFVVAVYGNQGGYRLTKELGEINLLQLNHSLVGRVQVAECLDTTHSECRCFAACPLTGPMRRLNEKIENLFESTSLENLRSDTTFLKEFA